MSERPGVGDGFLFPSPNDPSEPITRHLADKWLRKAEELARLEPLKGTLWHAYRRGWATARKGLPVADVAKAGGWKTPQVVQSIYQQADAATTLRVVLHTAEVEDVG
jgi:integrase